MPPLPFIEGNRRNHNGGRCRHRPPLVPALTAVAGWRGHLSLGGFGSRGGRKRPPSLSPGFRSEAAKPRSVPGGSRERPEGPSPIPSGRSSGPCSPPQLPGSDQARPKPRRLLRLASGPKPLRSPFRKTMGRSLPVSRGTSQGRSPSKSPFGSRRRPKALPLSRSPSPRPKPRRRTPFRVAAGAKALPRLPAGSGLGAIPASFAGSAPPSSPRTRSPALPWRLREIPPRMGLRSCGRGFVRSLAFRLGRQRPWGSDGAFGLGLRPSVWRSVSGPPPFPATS